jgi:hypothetical protein
MTTATAVTELINIAFLLYGGTGDAGARIIRPRIMNESRQYICPICDGCLGYLGRR